MVRAMSNHDVPVQSFKQMDKAYSCLCCNTMHSTSLQTADMTDVRMRLCISINALLAEHVGWAEVEKAMLLAHFPPSPAFCHHCTDWHVRPDVPACAQQISIVHMAFQGWPMSLESYWTELLPIHVAHTYSKVGRAGCSSCLRASSV